MMLERSLPKPLYVQLEEIIREKIDSKEWTPLNSIPSENELSRIYGLSRMTVRSVITQLVNEGLLYRVPGKGTFVSEPKITTQSLSYIGIREQLEKMGYEISTKVISMEKSEASRQIADILSLKYKEEVYVLQRVRFLKGEPLSLHISYIPVGLCSDLETKNLEDEQLCVILKNDYGLARGRVEETLESYPAAASEARLLNVKPGYPLLLLQDIIFSRNGSPFEYSKVMFRGDKIKLKFEFEQ
jgi:GntR family transcriptional regulator